MEVSRVFACRFLIRTMIRMMMVMTENKIKIRMRIGIDKTIRIRNRVTILMCVWRCHWLRILGSLLGLALCLGL